MLAFRDCLLLCELVDLGFAGVPYTYNNGQHGDRNVQVRLDRAYADETWKDLFPATRVLHLATPCSDHAPLLIQLGDVEAGRTKGNAPRYEIMWERHRGLPDVVATSWVKHKPSGGLG